MKLTLSQLTHHLKQQLAPLYLISGNEILLVEEARDLIRQRAASAGYEKGQVFHVETGFNWEEFLAATNNLSLFSERELIAVHLQGKLTDAGNRTLQKYVEQPARDKIVVIICEQLEASQQRSAWYKAVEQYAVVVNIWPVTIAEMPGWIGQRLLRLGMKVEQEGIAFLAEQAAGNLLAAAQEIEKLHLLYGKSLITAAQVLDAITDNSRFTVFNLIDSTLAGKKTQAIRILENLQSEGAEPTLILWALAREVRNLINLCTMLQQGITIEAAMTKLNVWQNRKVLLKQALQRHDLESSTGILRQLAAVDLIIKGADAIHLLWHCLSDCTLKICANTKIS